MYVKFLILSPLPPKQKCKFHSKKNKKKCIFTAVYIIVLFFGVLNYELERDLAFSILERADVKNSSCLRIIHCQNSFPKWYDPHHAKIGLIIYANNVAPDQPAHPCNLVRRFPIPLTATEGFVFSLADGIAPYQAVQICRLVLTYAA